MKASNLEDALKKPRFKPFDLCLGSGNAIRVKHPDCVLFNESRTVAVVAEGEHLHIVDLEHVSNLALIAK